MGLASARAFTKGGAPAQALARAFAIAIGFYGCLSVQPIIYGRPLHLVFLVLVLQVLSPMLHPLVALPAGPIPSPLALGDVPQVQTIQALWHLMMCGNEHAGFV